MHLILVRISYYRQRVGTNGCTAWLDNFPSFVFVSLPVFIVIVTCQRFSSSSTLVYFFYFSTFSRQFVAGEDLRVAGDIAGRRRFLTTLYIVHLKLLLCENSSYLNYFQL